VSLTFIFFEGVCGSEERAYEAETIANELNRSCPTVVMRSGETRLPTEAPAWPTIEASLPARKEAAKRTAD
jgi:hypothetical protein